MELHQCLYCAENAFVAFICVLFIVRFCIWYCASLMKVQFVVLDDLICGGLMCFILWQCACQSIGVEAREAEFVVHGSGSLLQWSCVSTGMLCVCMNFHLPLTA